MEGAGLGCSHPVKQGSLRGASEKPPATTLLAVLDLLLTL